MVSPIYISLLVLTVVGQLHEVSSVLTLQMNEIYQINFTKDILNQFYTCLCDSKDQSCSVLLERDMSFSYQARFVSVSRFPSSFNQSQDESYSRNFICSVPTSFQAHQTMGCIRLKHTENVCENMELCESINLIYGDPCENGFAGVFWLYPGRIHQKIDNRYVSLSQCGGDCFNRSTLMTSVVTPSHLVTDKTEPSTSISVSHTTPMSAATTTANRQAEFSPTIPTRSVKRVSHHQVTFKPAQAFIDIEMDVELIIIIVVASSLFVVLLSILICVICACKRKGAKLNTQIKTKNGNFNVREQKNVFVVKPPKGVAYLCEGSIQTGSAIILANELSDTSVMFKNTIQSGLTQLSTTKDSLEQMLLDKRDCKREILKPRVEMQTVVKNVYGVETAFGNLDIVQNASKMTDVSQRRCNNSCSESLRESLCYEDVKETDQFTDDCRQNIQNCFQGELRRTSVNDEEYYTTINDVITYEKHVYTRLNEEVKMFSNPYNELQRSENSSHEKKLDSCAPCKDSITFYRVHDCDCGTNECTKSCSQKLGYCNVFTEGKSENDMSMPGTKSDINMSSDSNVCTEKHIYFELEKELDNISEYSASYEDEIIF